MNNSKLRNVYLLFFLVVAFALITGTKVQAMESQKSAYFQFEGEVQRIDRAMDVAHIYLISLKTSDGHDIRLQVYPETYVESGLEDKLEKGVKVVGYARVNRPVTLMIPPTYVIDALVEPQFPMMRVADFFDRNGISRDGQLKINPSSGMKVYSADGEVYKGSLEEKNLLIYYKSSTYSIPAQTVPERIIVLESTQKPHVLEPFGERVTFPIVANGFAISNSEGFKNDANDIMIPALAALEGLGYSFEWDPVEGILIINKGIFSFQVDSNQYVIGRRTPIELKSAPVVVGGRLYLPLEYFKSVLGVKNAYEFEGQVELDNRDDTERVE